MLIECWPLLSAMPRPYQRSPRFGQRPGREALVPPVVEAADHVAVAVAEHGRQSPGPRCARRTGTGPAPSVVQRPAREAERLEGGLHLLLEIAARAPARAPGSGFRSASRRGGPGPAGSAGIEIGFGAGDGFGGSCGSGWSGDVAASSAGGCVPDERWQATSAAASVRASGGTLQAAVCHPLRAARVERAAGRRIERIREGEAEPGVRHAEAGLGRQHRREQRPGVGMARACGTARRFRPARRPGRDTSPRRGSRCARPPPGCG